MTALGKILAIFVLLLSLVWCGLVVSGHVARTNWKTEAEKYRKSAQEAATAANEARAEMDKQAKAYAGQIAILTGDKKSLAAQIATLDTTNQKQNGDIQQLLTLLNKYKTDSALAQANLTQAGKQNDILFTKQAETEKQRDNALTAQKNAEANALSIKLEADGIKKQNERYQNQLITQADQLRDLRTGGNRPGGARVVPVPESIRGTVDRVNGEYVSISVGADADVREGAVLDVVRYGDKPMYLGSLTITEVQPKKSVGLFQSKDGPTAKGDALPKSGDTVMKIQSPGR
ncbi:MAG TPA: hypothetical protein VGJ05_04290 [Fimbriiglobus sp.]|jgi:hypothetical protein